MVGDDHVLGRTTPIDISRSQSHSFSKRARYKRRDRRTYIFRCFRVAIFADESPPSLAEEHRLKAYFKACKQNKSNAFARGKRCLV